MLDFLQQRRDDLKADINLLTHRHAVLHGYNHATEHLRELKQLQSLLIHHFRAMKQVKLDVVADFRNLADVILAIFLDEIGLDLLPSLELYKVRLSIAIGNFFTQAFVHTNADMSIILHVRVDRDVVLLSNHLANHIFRLHISDMARLLLLLWSCCALVGLLHVAKEFLFCLIEGKLGIGWWSGRSLYFRSCSCYSNSHSSIFARLKLIRLFFVIFTHSEAAA